MKNCFVKALTFCLFLLPVGIAAQSSKTVTIHGTVKNFSSQVMIENLSDMQYLLPPNP